MGAEHAGAARVAGGRAGAGADRAGGGGECEGWGPRARRAWAFQRASAPGELYSQEARSLLGYAWEQGQVRREGLGAGGRGCACLPSAQPCCWQQRQLMCLSTACVAVANSHSRSQTRVESIEGEAVAPCHPSPLHPLPTGHQPRQPHGPDPELPEPSGHHQFVLGGGPGAHRG